MGEARDLAEAYYECFASGDFDGAVALYTDGSVLVTPDGSFNHDAHKVYGKLLKDAFPDGHMVIRRAVESGDEAYITGRFRGTHQGDLVTPGGTIPASGKSLDFLYVDYFKISGGKIAQHEGVWNQMAILGQLGALPS